MAEFAAKVLIRFTQGVARHGWSTRTEERELEKPENHDLRSALIYHNGRRYYVLSKLEIYERRIAAAAHPPRRPPLRTKRNVPRATNVTEITQT